VKLFELLCMVYVKPMANSAVSRKELKVRLNYLEDFLKFSEIPMLIIV